MILKLINIPAASLINSMDQSVDSCDDFYRFACGSFIKNTILNDDEFKRNSFTVIKEAKLNQKRMIVTEPIQPDELRPFKMMKLLFKSCMDLGIMILQIYHISKILYYYYYTLILYYILYLGVFFVTFSNCVNKSLSK